MNEFRILKAIERAPHYCKWDRLAYRAWLAWTVGDKKRLRKIGRRALQRKPCWEWEVEIRDCLDELERTT